MINAFFPFFALLACGYGARFLPGAPAPEAMRRVLNTVVLNFFLPALSFHVLSRTRLDVSFIALPLIAAASLAANLGATAGAYRLLERRGLLKLAGPEWGAVLLGASFGNITFLGLPVLVSLFGNPARKVALLWDIFALGPLVYVLGATIAARYGKPTPPKKGVYRFHRPSRGALTESLRKVARIPYLWGAVAGMAWHAAGMGHLPKPIGRTLSMMTEAIAPLMLFNIGLALKLPLSMHELRRFTALGPAIAIKLVLSPLVAAVLLHGLAAMGLMPLPRWELQASVVEAAMPTMAVTLLLADVHGLDSALLARLIAATTVLSFFTVPAIVALM